MSLTTPHGRKAALRVLDAGRLRELVDHAGLVVTDRRARDGLVQALADARRVDLSSLVGKLSRDELKAMCRALGLPEDGREKAPLIARLMTGRADGLEDGTTWKVARPWRAEVIALMKRDELAEIVEKLELSVGDRRVHRELADAVESSKAPLGELLEYVSRARLKELCRELGLEDGGRERAPIIDRIVRQGADEEDDEDEHVGDEDKDDLEGRQMSVGAEIIQELLGTRLVVSNANGYWPAQCVLEVGVGGIPIDLHARVVGGTGRNPLERRIQNPAKASPIAATQGRACLLFGAWIEQGRDRAVVVAFDAYRRQRRTTRFSLFVPLSVLEEAADIGFVSHVNGRGETIYAFRPENLTRYLDAFAEDATWGDVDPGAWARPRITAKTPSARPPLAPALSKGSVEIRPRSGMFAAFARLNYKPWFALAELVDNAVQSFLTHRERLAGVGDGDTLVVDIHIDGDEISVADRAAGIRIEDFPRAFSPATPPDDATGLSEFGLGMKAAACWFADEWSVRTSTLDEDVERSISFDVPKISKEGLDFLPIQTLPGRAGAHYTVICMRRLRVKPRGSTLTKVKEHLASIYRLLIADGTLRIRVTAFGKTEELAYEQPKLLTAPYYSTPTASPLLWRRDLVVEIGTRRVRGWAGIMETGKHSRAGFSVFRRRRLIEGSVGEAYRPRQVFGAHNSFASQRIVGELYVEGFEVSHTKDGIQWGEDEDAIAYELRLQLDTDEMPMLDQAAGYRSRRKAASLPSDFGRDAINATVASTANLQISTEAVQVDGSSSFVDEPPATELKSSEGALQQRAFRMLVNGDQELDVRVELVRDKMAEWLESTVVEVGGQQRLQIRVNLDHAFSEEHLNDNERALEPVLRLAVALAVGEWQARMQGVKSSGAIRKNANALLRHGLSSAQMRDSTNGDDA